MLFDIFSGFDDHNFVMADFALSVWLIVFVVVVNVLQSFWVCSGGFFSFIRGLLSVVGELVFRRLRGGMGGSVAVFSSLFCFLVGLNLMGLVPYIFSLTSHLAINLRVSLPLWLCIVLIRGFYDLGGFLSHLQPIGSPALLNPFLCLIELVRNLVRPITLAVRLTANLRTGHILMGLLGLGFVNRGAGVRRLIMVVGLFYFIFEMGVCFIQSYIFTLLPTLYADEHPRKVH